MSQLGKAYIEVKADLRRFPAELKAGLKKALADALAGVDFGGLSAAAEEGGAEAATAAADGFNTQSKEKFRDSGRRAGRSMLQGLRDVFRRDSSDSNGFLASLGALLGGVGAAVTGALAGAGAAVPDGGGNAGPLLARLLPGGGGGGGGDGDGEGLVNAMVEGFNQIAETLEELFATGADFLGMLQSGFASIFEGRGEQISAFLSSQLERIKEIWARLREQGTEVFNRLFDEEARERFRDLIARGRDWFTDMARRGRAFFNDLINRSRPFFRNLIDRGRTFFRDWETNHGSSFFGRLLTRGRGFFSRLGSQAAGFASRMATQVSGALTRAFATIGPALGDAFSKIGSALGSLGGPIGALLPLAGLAAIIPVLVLIAGAAVQASAALLALPAALGVLVAAFAPVMIALSGFSEAVGAGLSGDTEKFAEALKGLTPAAREVAKEIVALGPAFKLIKANVQDAFFKPLIGAFKPLATTLLPELNRGLTIVATSMGRFAAAFVDLLTAPDIVEAIGDVFDSTARIVDRLAPSVVNLVGTLIGIMEKGLPFVERFFGALADGADKAAGFFSKIQQNGQFQEWVEKAARVLSTAFGIAKEFGAYLFTLLGGKIGDAGAGFLDDLLNALEDINAFMQTSEGQEYINNLATAFKFVGKIITGFIALFPFFIRVMNGAVDVIRALGGALEAIGRGAVDGVMWIGEFFVGLWDTISSGAVSAWDATWEFFANIGGAVADFFTQTVPRWFDSFINFFEELPGKAVDAGSSLADDLGNWIKGAAKAMFDGFLFGIGVVIGLILAFPGMVVRALQALPGALASLWDSITEGVATAWNWIVEVVVGAVTAIPGLLAEAGTAIWDFFVGLWNSIVELTLSVPGMLADAGRAIGQFFSDLWNGVVTDSYNAVVNGVNSVIDWFASIPGKIAALGPRVLEAARGIGRSIARGLTEIGNFASDLGAKVTASLKSSINYVISGINRGISAVDDKIPGGLPRIPALAKGAIVDTPTLALFGEAGAEVVIPLTNRQRAQELAEQSGLLGMLKGAQGGTNVTVIAYLDATGQMIRVARTVVVEELDQQGAQLGMARTT